jgi:hypothetical protein
MTVGWTQRTLLQLRVFRLGFFQEDVEVGK